jgi:hypothetical protein
MSDFTGLKAIVTGGASGIGARGDVNIGDDEECHRVYDITVVGAVE